MGYTVSSNNLVALRAFRSFEVPLSYAIPITIIINLSKIPRLRYLPLNNPYFDIDRNSETNIYTTFSYSLHGYDDYVP